MERYQMSRPCSRPYHSTCGMAPSGNRGPRRMPGQNECEREPQCACHMPGAVPAEAAIYHHADEMPVAMAYVPCQKFSTTFDLCYALRVGTIFPDLCKPFCGKRGVR